MCVSPFSLCAVGPMEGAAAAWGFQSLSPTVLLDNMVGVGIVSSLIDINLSS